MIRHLRVRQGFVDPAQWAQLRSQLGLDFRDAADFAFLCGPREMEVLTLTWDGGPCRAREADRVGPDRNNHQPWRPADHSRRLNAGVRVSQVRFRD